MLFSRALVFLAFCAALAMPGARAADNVTIYRCTDAAGHLTLRDTPCGKRQQQQTRSMLRPKDAPPAVIERARRSQSRRDFSPPQTRVIVINTPRPLYECITPDGEHYTSDSDQGHPRFVPLWTLGYPMVPYTPGVIDSSGLAITRGNVHIEAGRTVLEPPLQVPAYAYNANTFVRDACYALPQAEVCDRLHDRRGEIRDRFFNAMPSERDVLRVEERGINARMDNDCGGH